MIARDNKMWRTVGGEIVTDVVEIFMTKAEAENLYFALQAAPSPLFSVDAIRDLHSALVEWRKPK